MLIKKGYKMKKTEIYKKCGLKEDFTDGKPYDFK